MNPFDIKMVVFSSVVSNAICAIAMALLWRQNRRRYAGLGLWLADFVMQWAAVVLLIRRRAAPDPASMVVGDTLLIGGTFLLYMGLERWVGKRGPQTHNLVLLAGFILVQTYFAVLHPNLEARNINSSLGLLVIYSQCSWLLLSRVDGDMRPITRGVGLVFAAFCLVSLIRVVVEAAMPPENDFFHAGIYNTLILLTYQMLFIVLTFSLSLMLSRRLFAGLERDMAARQRLEAALHESEANFRQLFDNTAHGIFIIEVTDDGSFRIGDSNRAEEVAAAICKEDVRGRLLAEAFPPEMAQARQADYSRCLQVGRPIAYEEEVHLPVGRRVYYTTLAPVRDAAGRFYRIIGSTLEITNLKQAEETMQLRLKLFEFAANHSRAELLQYALDEIERITDSAVGFYHFVEADQQTLVLQACFRRALQEFCTDRDVEVRCNLAEAGEWGDCVRQRRPIIHNDCTALPRHKGLPPCRARVKRELIAPTLREGRVVSVLGVGDKPTDYDARDAELVAYVADVVWTVIERKQADDARLELAALEERRRLARDLHDSMTQSLHSLALLAETVQHMVQQEHYAALPPVVETLRNGAGQALRDMRLLMYELQLAPEGELDLFQILHDRLERVEQRAGIQTQFSAQGVAYIPPDMRASIFFVATEALNNALRHAHAAVICVRLDAAPSQIDLCISDNGCGFDLARVTPGMGLRNMQTRAATLGGQLTVDSAPGQGAAIRLHIDRSAR